MAIGQLSPETGPPPGTVELLCDVLKRPRETRQASGPNRPTTQVVSAQAQEFQEELRLKEAVWSLEMLGRSAASAVPLLLSTFEVTPGLRELTAESLVEITRGTADEDRVIASLAKVWEDAPRRQKAVFARALRSLGPKSEQLVPGIRGLPDDGTRSEIRRVRYPRTKYEQVVRE